MCWKRLCSLLGTRYGRNPRLGCEMAIDCWLKNWRSAVEDRGWIFVQSNRLLVEKMGFCCRRWKLDLKISIDVYLYYIWIWIDLLLVWSVKLRNFYHSYYYWGLLYRVVRRSKKSLKEVVGHVYWVISNKTYLSSKYYSF